MPQQEWQILLANVKLKRSRQTFLRLSAFSVDVCKQFAVIQLNLLKHASTCGQCRYNGEGPRVPCPPYTSYLHCAFNLNKRQRQTDDTCVWEEYFFFFMILFMPATSHALCDSYNQIEYICIYLVYR